MLISSRIKDKH